MLRNLVIEMARHQISEKKIAHLLNCDYRWVRKMINEQVLESVEFAQFGNLGPPENQTRILFG